MPTCHQLVRKARKTSVKNSTAPDLHKESNS
ncbi:MAG: 30S ribosomal protein S12, partial [Lachnospiraceae bacterium]|nr:30S ribosomal protein S12 [Lachnospiraceae bacterium]